MLKATPEGASQYPSDSESEKPKISIKKKAIISALAMATGATGIFVGSKLVESSSEPKTEPSASATVDPSATAETTPSPEVSQTMEISNAPVDSPVPTTETPTPSFEATPQEDWTAINEEFLQTMGSWENMSRGDKILFMRDFASEQIPSFDSESVYKTDETEAVVRDFFAQLNLISNLWGDETVDGHREYASNLVEGVTRSVSNDLAVEQITQDLSNGLDFILSDECAEDWCVTSRKDNYQIEQILGISDSAFAAIDADGTPMRAVAATVVLQNPPDSDIPASTRTRTVVLDMTSSKPIAIGWLPGTNVTVEYNGPGTGETYVGDLLEEKTQDIK